MTAKNWIDAIDNWTDEEIPQAIVEFQRLVATDALISVIQRSPVDTGRFKGNHVVSIGKPTDAVNVNRFDPAGGSSISEGDAVLAKMTVPEIVYIQNALPYASRLEDGYSRQAPEGIYAVSRHAIAVKYDL